MRPAVSIASRDLLKLDISPRLPLPKIPELTSARFIAAFSVFAMHSLDVLPISGVVKRVLEAGEIGVAFFFVLSGFVLTYTYRHLFEARIRARQYFVFLSARFFRIYPAYVLGLLLVTAVHAAAAYLSPEKFGWPPNGVSSWIVNLLALQTFSRDPDAQQFWNAPAWSISTEFCFYLCFPAIVAFVTRNLKTRAVLIAGVLLCVVVSFAFQAFSLLGSVGGWLDRGFWVGALANRNAFWRIWEFVSGVMAAQLLFEGHLTFLQKALWRNTLLAVSLVLIIAPTFVRLPHREMAFLIERQALRLGVVNILPFVGLIVALAAGRTFLSPVLRNKGFVLLGEASFALYIYHWSVVQVFEMMIYAGHRPDVWQAITGMGAVIVFSIVSFKFYETPMRRLLSRHFRPAREPSVADLKPVLADVRSVPLKPVTAAE